MFHFVTDVSLDSFILIPCLHLIHQLLKFIRDVYLIISRSLRLDLVRAAVDNIRKLKFQHLRDEVTGLSQ